MIHGLWYEKAKQVGIEMPTSLWIEPTMFNCLLLSLPTAILISVVVFACTLKSKHDEQASYWKATSLPLFSFLAVTVGGMAGSCLIPLAFNWVLFLGAFILGGVTAFSHSANLSMESLEKYVKNSFDRIEDPELMTKWLELEHVEYRSSLQWIVSASLIFTTAGLVTWYARPGLESYPSELLSTSLQNVFFIGAWAVIGIYLGIMQPLILKMGFLKKMIKKIATGDYAREGVNMTLRKESLEWLDKKVESLTYASRSHAIEALIAEKIKAEQDKKGE